MFKSPEEELMAEDKFKILKYTISAMVYLTEF